MALAGTLHQHLPEVIGIDTHQVVPGMTANTIAVAAGTALAVIVGTTARGTCHHHQAIDRLGRQMRVVAFVADGTLEAVEIAGRRFVLGVQWHPEQDFSDDGLFKALVEAAAG